MMKTLLLVLSLFVAADQGQAQELKTRVISVDNELPDEVISTDIFESTENDGSGGRALRGESISDQERRGLTAFESTAFDAGWDAFRGFYNIPGHGCRFCRWVGNKNSVQDPAVSTTDGPAWWSCRGVDSNNLELTVAGHFGATFTHPKCRGIDGTEATCPKDPNAGGDNGYGGMGGWCHGAYYRPKNTQCCFYCRWVGNTGCSAGNSAWDPIANPTSLVNGQSWWSCRISGNPFTNSPAMASHSYFFGGFGNWEKCNEPSLSTDKDTYLWNEKIKISISQTAAHSPTSSDRLEFWHNNEYKAHTSAFKGYPPEQVNQITHQVDASNLAPPYGCGYWEVKFARSNGAGAYVHLASFPFTITC